MVASISSVINKQASPQERKKNKNKNHNSNEELEEYGQRREHNTVIISFLKGPQVSLPDV